MRKKIFKHVDFILLDIISIIISLLLGFYLRHYNLLFFEINIYKEILFFLIIMDILLSLLLSPYSDVLKRGYLIEFINTIKFDSIIFLFTVLYLFVIKSSSEFSRIVLFLTFILYFIFSFVSRLLLKKYILNKKEQVNKYGNKSLLIITKNKDNKNIINVIKKYNFDYKNIILCFIDKKIIKSKDIKNVINRKQILSYVSTNWVDDILILCDIKDISKKVLNELKITNIPLHFAIDSIDLFEEENQSVNKLLNYNVISCVRNERTILQEFIKRLFDIIGGLFGCILTIFLIVIIGPIIYIKSPGNIFYVSNRVGKNGKVFKFYKFRSMVLNADEYKTKYIKRNRIKDGMMFKIENDPRIIKGIGTFIRKSSLDEFPQFFNVLKGDMSLVGTRPPTLDEWEKYSPYYRSRLSIKPGITGLWQVSGRSNITDFDEVIKLDNKYINNWSISLDIKILFMTLKVIFNSKNNGAY